MKRRLTRILFAGALSLGALGVSASIASADTVKIGSDLNHPNTPALCVNCIGVQAGASAGLTSLSLTSPANGTVTSWSVRSGDLGAIYGLRILRGSGTSFLSAGASTLAPAVPDATDTTRTQSTSLPIQKGDNIGVSVDAAHNLPQFTTTNMADVLEYAIPPFADGTTGTFTNIGGLHELLVQATVKFCKVPNVIGHTAAVAASEISKADCASTSATQALQLRAIKKKFSKKKKSKIRAANGALQAQDGKVLAQSIAADTTQASPGTPVALTIGQVVKPTKKKKKKRH